MTVTHLFGAFPVLCERPVLREIAAVAQQGLQCKIIACRPAVDSPPSEFLSLAGQVRYLDVGRKYGNLAGGLASLFTALGGAVVNHSVLPAALSPSPTFHAISAFWRRIRLHRFLQQGDSTLLHAQFGHLGFLARPVMRQLRIPFVLSFRGQDVSLVARADEVCRAELFKDAARIFARSNAMVSDLQQLGCPKDKLFVQPTGIAVADIPFTERRPPEQGRPVVILSVGRLIPRKGMGDAIRAVAKARPGPAVPVLRIVGEGPERNALHRLAERLGIASRIEFLGALPYEKIVREIMPAAHLFLLPCRITPEGEKEGIPNSIKEAQASGLPVISTFHAGIPECVSHSHSGLLSKEGDVETLAAHLDKLLDNPILWTDMGRQGRDIVEKQYDIEKIVPKLLQHYQDVVNAFSETRR